MTTAFKDEVEGSEAVRSSLGKIIKDVKIEDNALIFTFKDNMKLKLRDNGQSCCETRYMRSDDNLSDYIGDHLLDIELRDAPTQEDEDGVYEVQFLVVKTNKGQFVISNHNEHNGYYGGFSIVANNYI